MRIYAKRALLRKLSHESDGTSVGFKTKLESESDRLIALSSQGFAVTSSSANGASTTIDYKSIPGATPNHLIETINQALDAWPDVVTSEMTTAQQALDALLASNDFVVVRGVVSNFQASGAYL